MIERNRRIAIIGGGSTGLALAYLLGQTGIHATILEKGSELSGLLACTTINQIPIERYYHHFFTHDHYLLELLDELGLGQKIIWRPSASAVYAEGTVSPFITKVDYLRLPFLSWGAKLRSGLATLDLRRQAPEKIPPTLTAETYLRSHFGTEGWEKMWRPLLINKFGDHDAYRISAQWIAKRIQIRSRSEKNGREMLGYLDGSYHILFERLRQAILHQGGEIKLHSNVTALTRLPNGRYRVNGEEYDTVVSTIAPNLLKHIAPDINLPAVTYRAVITPLFFLRSSVTPHYWINILDTAVPFSVIVNQQSLMPTNYYRGSWPLYIGHYLAETDERFTKSNEELAEYYLSFLRKIWPGIDQEITGYQISRTKFAQPVVTAPWLQLPHTTNLPNVYSTSMAHIFPEDRGVNYAIREARKICALLVDQYS